jgi:hypothetical protein
MKELISLLSTFAIFASLHGTALASSAPENFIYTRSGDLEAARAR